MLAVLQAVDYEGGLTFTEWLRAVQIEGKDGKPVPSKSTFQRRLEKLKKPRGPVYLSAATNKYALSPEYARRRAAFSDDGSDGGSPE
jgi:hypothetical protein